MNIFEKVHLIGGRGGGSFSLTGGSNGKILEKIGVWVGGWQIKAIRVWLTDSTPQTFGNPSGPYKEFAFGPGERITHLSLWGNGAGSRAGAIRFSTSSGNSFDHGMNDWGRKQEYPIDVGSGICIGVMGNCGADIDNIGFVFLKDIEDVRLKNVHYPTLDSDKYSIVPEVLDEYSDQNNGSIEKNWEFSGDSSITKEQSWSFTTGVEAFTEISVEAGVPEVAKVEAKFGFKVSSSSTHEKSHSETKSLHWGQSGTLKPGESISLKAVTRKGRLNIPYEGTMQVKLKNGTVFTYPLKGKYEGLSYTGVDIVSD